MKTVTSRILLSVFFLSLLSFTNKNDEVPYPDRIKWSATPTVFIESLYRGVLGRSPENRSVVNAWASNITSNHSSRLKVFWGFVNSREYQNSRWAKQPKTYTIYYKYVNAGNRNKKSYYIAKKPSGAHNSLRGKYTFGIAMAVKDYTETFDSNSTKYHKTKGLNFLNVRY